MRAKLLLVFVAILCATSVARAEEGIWLLIDTAVNRIDVYRNDKAIERISNVSIGSGGSSKLRLQGDPVTPLGEFRIDRINYDSRFHIFLGLDYPSMSHADRALAAGMIDQTTYSAFLDALSRTGHPPQNTPLGGDIGIHGIGDGDPAVHARFNWTNGCIAVTNEQIERLARLVRVGTRVFIR